VPLTPAPHIDSLAQHGSRFERFHVASPVTFLAEKVARKATSERGLTIRRLNHRPWFATSRSRSTLTPPLTATPTAVKNIVAEILTQPMHEAGDTRRERS